MTGHDVHVDEALERLLGRASATPAAAVGVERALGRVLARDLRSVRTLPPTDESAMDGFALRATDVAGGGAVQVVGEALAGRGGPAAIGVGQALYVATGAPLPDGADAVVPIESVVEDGPSLRVVDAPEIGAHIRRAGEDVREGDLLLRAGERLTLGGVAAATGTGSSTVHVHRAPRVAILTTGDEVGRSRPDALGPALGAAVHAAGGQVVILRHVTDRARAVRRIVVAAAARADLLVTTGGVSVGRADATIRVLDKVGEVLVRGVALRPGHPFTAALVGDALVTALPGNPVAALACFDLFTRPLLDRLQGGIGAVPAERARLACTVPRRPDVHQHLRARLTAAAEGLVVDPSGPRGSARLGTLAGAAAWLPVPPGDGALAQGDLVDVRRMAGS